MFAGASAGGDDLDEEDDDANSGTFFSSLFGGDDNSNGTGDDCDEQQEGWAIMASLTGFFSSIFGPSPEGGEEGESVIACESGNEPDDAERGITTPDEGSDEGWAGQQTRPDDLDMGPDSGMGDPGSAVPSAAVIDGCEERPITP